MPYNTETLDKLLTESLKNNIPASGLHLFGINQLEEEDMMTSKSAGKPQEMHSGPTPVCWCSRQSSPAQTFCWCLLFSPSFEKDSFSAG